MSEVITSAQRSFIETLLSDRLVTLGFTTVADAATAMNLAMMAKRDASTIIERLKFQVPKDPDIEMPPVVAQAQRSGKGNRPGTCHGCGHTVNQDTGYYFLTAAGRWSVHHKVGECILTPPPILAPVTEGFYKAGENIVQVYMTQNRRLAGKLLSVTGHFNYTSGAVRMAQAGGVRMTPQEVADAVCLARYGAPIGSPELLKMAVAHSTGSGSCMFCDKVLDDPRSNPALGGAGYGPKCAQNYGLPWGGK